MASGRVSAEEAAEGEEISVAFGPAEAPAEDGRPAAAEGGEGGAAGVGGLAGQDEDGAGERGRRRVRRRLARRAAGPKRPVWIWLVKKLA